MAKLISPRKLALSRIRLVRSFLLGVVSAPFQVLLTLLALLGLLISWLLFSIEPLWRRPNRFGGSNRG